MINLDVSDVDPLDKLAFYIQSHSSLGGAFYRSSGVAFPQGGFILSNVSNTRPTTAVQVSFVAPRDAFGDSYDSLSFYVKDTNGLTSNTVKVTVNISPNSPPQIVDVAAITLPERSNSTTFVLTGTDSDLVDQQYLRVIITSLPTRVTLWIVGYGPVLRVGTIISVGSTPYLVSAVGFGQDSFTFQVYLLCSLHQF